MSEGTGRHSAEPSDARGADPATVAAEGFERPDGVAAAFAPRQPQPRQSPPQPVPSPEERVVFGRPSGGGEFAPLPGERIPPRPIDAPAVPQVMAEAYRASRTAVQGFDPPPGARIWPAGAAPESPWWNPDARVDPWRDPSSPYWLGRGAIFAGGTPAQLDPAEDVEFDEDRAFESPAEEEPDTRSGKRPRLGLSVLSMVLLVALVAGALGGGVGYWLTNRGNHLLHRSDVSLAKTGKPANRPPGSVADIAKRVGPAVVSIAVTTSTEYGVGSGVVIDKSGYVLTNNHVVAAAAGGKGTIVVTFADEATARAQIVGLDATSDLAVLKVPTDQLTVASLGDSSSLVVGDPVIALGSPLGLQGTVTLGIVSALDRAVHVDENDVYLDAIQTDAAINPGNSGGALVDASGAVVGINSALAVGSTNASGQQSPASGIGFAIPINYARGIAQQLIRSGKAVHASLGAQGRSVTANDGLDQGAYLSQIIPGQAAAKAGLQPGDVIVVADGKPVPSYDQLVVIVQAHKPGDSMSLTYFRGSAKRTTTLTLGAA